MGSLVYRSVPTNLKLFPDCSPALSNHFFFRPASLWLSPGRRTLLCWWTNYSDAYSMSLLGGVESGMRTITQSEVLSGPKDKKHKNKAKQQKQNPQNPAKEALTKTAPIGMATYVPMNYEILHRNKGTTPDHTARSCEGVQQNNPLSSAETQDPPCQDPGDRAEKPSGHETSSQWRAVMQWIGEQHIGRHPTVWGSQTNLRCETSN